MGFIINAYRYIASYFAHTTFDGTNEYVSMGDVLDQNYNDDFSISIWFNTDSLSSTQFLLTKQEGSGNFRGYNIRIETSGKIQFALLNTTSNLARVETTTTISTSTWYHLVITKSTSSSVSGLKIYINGVSDTLTTINDTLGSNTTTHAVDFQISARNGTTLPFDGLIDKVIVYDAELTSGNVTDIYNYGRKAGLIGIGNEVSQWEMDTLNPVDEIGSNDGTSVNMDSSNIVVG